MINKNTVYAVGAQAIWIRWVIAIMHSDDHSPRIEFVQPVLRANPQKAILILRDGHNIVGTYATGIVPVILIIDKLIRVPWVTVQTSTCCTNPGITSRIDKDGTNGIIG